MHGVIGMLGKNRKGRKRKSGRRVPSGDLIARKAPDFRAQAALQPHRRGLPEAVRSSEKAGSVLGCMNLTGFITDEQYEAGRRYSQLVGQYLATINAPKGTAGNGRGYDCLNDQDCRDKPHLCPCALRRNRYDAAYAAISDVGRAAHMAINRVVIEDVIPSVAVIPNLRLGLDALAKHFGLTNHRH